MEQYIDEFGNLQFKNVGTTNEYPFKSMTEMAAENALAINNMFTTPKDTLTSLSNFQDNYYLPSSAVKSNVVPPQKFEAPYEIIGGQKVYLGDALGRAQALEKADFFQQPTGIMTQAKDFFTQTVPRTISGIAQSAIDFIPGMRFIKSLDKFNTLPYQDRKFINSVMDMKGIPGSGIYVDPNTGLLKDVRGKNVRSLRGNYAESIEKDYNAKVESLQKSKDKWTDKFGDLNNTNEFGKTWNEMNKKNLSDFAFLTNMKNKLDNQKRETLDKIKAQVKAGVTANIGQSLHGDFKKSGDGNKGFGGFKDVAAYDKSQQATYDRAVDRHRG